MTEKEMLGTLQLVWDNMGLQMQDRRSMRRNACASG